MLPHTFVVTSVFKTWLPPLRDSRQHFIYYAHCAFNSFVQITSDPRFFAIVFFSYSRHFVFFFFLSHTSHSVEAYFLTSSKAKVLPLQCIVWVHSKYIWNTYKHYYCYHRSINHSSSCNNNTHGNVHCMNLFLRKRTSYIMALPNRFSFLLLVLLLRIHAYSRNTNGLFKALLSRTLNVKG